FKLTGQFAHVRTRSVPRQSAPYQRLAEVTKEQPTFDFDNVSGTLVIFYFPEYTQGLNVPGYHMHFLLDDKTGGGLMAGVVSWLLLRARLVVPLEALSQELRILQDNTQARALDVPAGHALGRLPEQIEGLLCRLKETERATTEAIAFATRRAEEQKSRLEAILVDLAEGVVVCNLDHRILLYNQAARRLLHRPAGLGLDRPLFGVLAEQPIRQTLEMLRRSASDASPVLRIHRCVVPALDSDIWLKARLGLIHEPSGEVSGYVLTFTETAEGGVPAASPVEPMAPRPEFYDFDLFRPARTTLTETPLRKIPFVVFDTETTGLNPDGGDELISIGAVRVVNGRLLTGETYLQLIDPGRSIPESSIKFHGITADMVAGQPMAREVLPAFKAFAGDAVLVAYNIAFDMAFLAKREKEAGVAFDNPVLDALLLAAHVFPDQPDHSLSAMAHRLGVNVEGRHTALGDAMATAKLWVKLLVMLEARGLGTFGQAVEISQRMMKQRQAQSPGVGW
ncbi:MAG: PAS domain-containing protein, partial [Methylacidiphilales bacterium]|nr:PAS domain-containing protein [Candidatus Methylacidiphilales bacterium]